MSKNHAFLALLPTILDTQKTLAMTLSFADILPEHWHNVRGITRKNVAKIPYLTCKISLISGSYSNAEMAVLTRVTDWAQKIISSFFFSAFSQVLPVYSGSQGYRIVTKHLLIDRE